MKNTKLYGVAYNLVLTDGKNYRLRIEEDDSESPRYTFDNLCTMVLSRGYGDKQHLSNEEIEQRIMDGTIIVKPLYMYEHSGVCISTEPFGIPFDSWKDGFIYCTKEDAVKWFETEKDWKDKVLKAMDGEIETYNDWLDGRVYSISLYEYCTVKTTKEYTYQDGTRKYEETTEEELVYVDSVGGIYGEVDTDRVEYYFGIEIKELKNY